MTTDDPRTLPVDVLVAAAINARLVNDEAERRVVLALRDQGYSWRAVAEQLDLSDHKVIYNRYRAEDHRRREQRGTDGPDDPDQ